MEERPIFVYGTLKKGEPNNFLFKDGTRGFAKFLGKAKLTDKYPLVVATSANVPFLLPKEGVGKIVEGELYQVDSAMLKVLDKLEDHPKLYLRTDIDCLLITDESEQPLSDAVLIKSQVYFLPDFNPVLLDLPHLNSYADSDEKPFLISAGRNSPLFDKVKSSQN